MSRRRAATGLLVFVALWPGVTLWLQARFDVDPWKLMSFGMYAAPGRRLEDVRVRAWVRRGGGWEPFEGEAVERYRASRRTLGALAPLGPLREAAGADAVRVEVESTRLDAKSARVVRVRDEASSR